MRLAHIFLMSARRMSSRIEGAVLTYATMLKTFEGIILKRGGCLSSHQKVKNKHPARSQLIKDASVTQSPKALSHFYLISHFNNRRHIRTNLCSNDLGTNGVQAQFSYFVVSSLSIHQLHM